MTFISFLSFFFKSRCPKHVRFLPQLSPRRRLLTSLGRLVLVCNIVYVPIAALYHLYRLLFRQKKCIRRVISRYFESMTTRLMHLHYISQMWSRLFFFLLLELSLALSAISPVLSSPVVKQLAALSSTISARNTRPGVFRLLPRHFRNFFSALVQGRNSHTAHTCSPFRPLCCSPSVWKPPKVFLNGVYNYKRHPILRGSETWPDWRSSWTIIWLWFMGCFTRIRTLVVFTISIRFPFLLFWGGLWPLVSFPFQFRDPRLKNQLDWLFSQPSQ